MTGRYTLTLESTKREKDDTETRVYCVVIGEEKHYVSITIDPTSPLYGDDAACEASMRERIELDMRDLCI